jgi:mRNA-degrading endonuclease toxin of MazEF toxin-antitoxin module
MIAQTLLLVPIAFHGKACGGSSGGEPTATNGLKSLSRLMVDRITTVAKSRVGKQIGCLDDEDVVRLNRAVVVFLGLAGSS